MHQSERWDSREFVSSSWPLSSPRSEHNILPTVFFHDHLCRRFCLSKIPETSIVSTRVVRLTRLHLPLYSTLGISFQLHTTYDYHPTTTTTPVFICSVFVWFLLSTQFDPAPRDENWRQSKRVPDYFL